MANVNKIGTRLIMAAAIGIAAGARADLESGKQAYQRADYDVAREELLPLAKAGDADAQVYLGLMHATGRGVDKNPLAAARWYREAANQSHADGQFNLGLMYYKGQGVPPDYAAAVGLYNQAAEQGHAGAQLNLGVCYARGYGVLRNEEMAAYWFGEAAEQDNAAAQFNLGLTYSTGNGVQLDLAQAVEWYTKAAEQGYAPAQLNLGVCYERGLGVPPDLRAAANWYRLAAASGNTAAKANLARLVVTLGEPPAAEQPAAVGIEEGGMMPILVDSDLPNDEGEPMPDPDEAIVVDAPVGDAAATVGNIVTRADAVIGEVDTVVAGIDEPLRPAADVVTRGNEARAAEGPETDDLPRAEGVSGALR